MHMNHVLLFFIVTETDTKRKENFQRCQCVHLKTTSCMFMPMTDTSEKLGENPVLC